MGSHTYLVTNNLGCIITFTTSILQNTTAPISTIINSLELNCLTPTVNLIAVENMTYSWDGPGIIAGNNTPSVTVNLPGIYSLTLTASNGCTNTTTVMVTESFSTPTLAVTANTIIANGEQINLNVSGSSYSYTWTPSNNLNCVYCSNPVASPSNNTTYCVSSSQGTCVALTCVNIEVERCKNSSSVFLPNAFSPNSDGQNDVFCIQDGQSCINSITLIIYDRWGEKVFETNNPAFCWDGTYKGKLLDPAVFVYFAKATFTNGQTAERKGNVTLIR